MFIYLLRKIWLFWTLVFGTLAFRTLAVTWHIGKLTEITVNNALYLFTYLARGIHVVYLMLYTISTWAKFGTLLPSYVTFVILSWCNNQYTLPQCSLDNSSINLCLFSYFFVESQIYIQVQMYTFPLYTENIAIVKPNKNKCKSEWYGR